MKRLLVLLLVLSVLGGGCASAMQRAIIVPRADRTMSQVEQDKQECQAWAETYKNDDAALSAMAGAGLGAAGGAAVGAVAGAFGGRPGYGAGVGAGVGAALGLLEGIGYAVAENQRRERVAFAMCMGARGYQVGF